MDSRMKDKLERMLAQVYSRTDIPRTGTVAARVREAMAYLAEDREHYIEVAEPDVPAYMITERHGVICKLIPLARETELQRVKDHTETKTVVFSLMVTEDGGRFVSATTHSKDHFNPTRSSWTYPEYRYVEPEDIPLSARNFTPRKIRPAATKRDRKCYTLMFAAFARYCRDRSVNTIPHKTERAMIVMGRTPLQTLQIGGEKIPGLLIPLAMSDLREELRPDCRYSRKDELCLFVDVYGPKYLMKHRHIYSYFRKEGCGDTPGACIYEPTIEKQEIDYEYIELEDTPEKMDAYYF